MLQISNGPVLHTLPLEFQTRNVSTDIAFPAGWVLPNWFLGIYQLAVE